MISKGCWGSMWKLWWPSSSLRRWRMWCPCSLTFCWGLKQVSQRNHNCNCTCNLKAIPYLIVGCASTLFSTSSSSSPVPLFVVLEKEVVVVMVDFVMEMVAAAGTAAIVSVVNVAPLLGASLRLRRCFRSTALKASLKSLCPVATCVIIACSRYASGSSVSAYPYASPKQNTAIKSNCLRVFRTFKFKYM